jgi:hypothetical protein
MSERLTTPHEHFEALLEGHEHKALPDAEHAEPLRPGEKNPVDLLEAREAVQEITQVETQPNPLKRLEEDEKAAEPAAMTYVDQELKQISLRRELRHIQRTLPASQRTLSQLIHQPALRVVSEAAAGSVSRPSGLLGGGLVALLGTSSYLYYAKHVGFTYNYLVFFLLFLAGFAIGLVLELLVHLATRGRKSGL